MFVYPKRVHETTLSAPNPSNKSVDRKYLVVNSAVNMQTVRSFAKASKVYVFDDDYVSEYRPVENTYSIEFVHNEGIITVKHRDTNLILNNLNKTYWSFSNVDARELAFTELLEATNAT